MYTDIRSLAIALRQFADERNWQHFHSPKNLAAALIVEAGELLEHFQWISQEDSRHLAPENKQQVAHEMADVLIYLVRMADQLDIDLFEAASEKMALNAVKYPSITATTKNNCNDTEVPKKNQSGTGA